MLQNNSDSLNIGMILDGFYPSDIRVRKEAESLSVKYKVHILCVRNENELEYEEINGVSIHRKIFYKSFFEKGIVDILSSINFIQPYFKKKLPNFIKENKISFLHVHDLPLAKTGYKAAKKHHIKSILDLHENYAGALETWFSWRKSSVIKYKNQLFFSPKRWQSYEDSILKKFDKIIAVVEEMKSRITDINADLEEKIQVVTNTEKIEFSNNFNAVSENYFKDFSNKFIISYVGGFGPHRGLHTAILGMKKVIQQVPNALLVLIGPSNKDVRDYLQNIIVENGLEEFVIIKGSEPFHNVIGIMKNSQINIIPHVSNTHTESTIPHKLFQILLSNKPLLVSNCKPLKRVVEENDAGFVFEAGNPISFANEVEKIYSNYSKAMENAKNGYEKALNGNLNWEHTSKSLVALYDNL